MAAGKKSGGRTLILLALVLIIGAGGAFFLFRDRFLGNNNADETGDPNEVVDELDEMFQVANVIDIYVLQQPLMRGQVIEEGHLLPVSYPRERFMEGLFITNPGDAVGKRAMFDLEAGLPLTFSMVSGSTEGSYASFQIPKGYVAVTIPVDDALGISAVAYTLRAGDHVNVIGSMLFVDLNQETQTVLPDVVTPVYSPAANEPQPDTGGGDGTTTEETQELPTEFIPVTAQVDTPLGLMPWYGTTAVLPDISTASGQSVYAYLIPSETQRPRLVSQTIIQDAIVLWVGEYPLTDPESEPIVLNDDGTVVAESAVAPEDPNAETAVEPEEPKAPRVVTLVVSPQDAVTLNYLMLQQAKLSLALRAAADDQRVDTESVTLQFVMQQYNIPLPSPLEYGIDPRIDQLEFYEEIPVYTTP